MFFNLRNINITNNVIDGTNITSDGWWFSSGAIETTTWTTGNELMAHSVFSNINLTNNFNWGDPATNINLGTFGRITTMAGTPRIMQFGIKYGF